MIGFRGLTALALACAASAIACSSSSGSSGTPTKFACAADNASITAMDKSCISCIQSNCGSQFSDAFGSGYASLDLGGGACGSYISCIAGCACNDFKCEMNCGGPDAGGLPSPACTSAETAANSCEQQKCGSECTTTTGGGDDGGTVIIADDGGGIGTGPTVACDMSASGECVSGAFTSDECTQAGGTTMTSCPTAGVVGCCSIAGIKDCGYAPNTASDVMMACTQEMGTFSATP